MNNRQQFEKIYIGYQIKKKREQCRMKGGAVERKKGECIDKKLNFLKKK